MAFSNALLGIVHSLAHKTGAAFTTGHVPHGEANAIYLPYVIQFNAKDPTAKARYAEIAKFSGLPGSGDDELVASLVKKIRSLNQLFSIPYSLKEFGVLEDEFNEKLKTIAAGAVGDACTGTNPRNFEAADSEKILTAIYYGQDIDF
jgi:alcohol dehydrogenase class IV